MKKIQQTESTQEQVHNSKKASLSTLQFLKKHSNSNEHYRQSKSMTICQKYNSNSSHPRRLLSRNSPTLQQQNKNKIFKRKNASVIIEPHSHKIKQQQKAIRRSRQTLHYRNKSVNLDPRSIYTSQRKKSYGLPETNAKPKFDSNLDLNFFTMCLKKQAEFFSAQTKTINSCIAQQVLIQMLNYSIDYRDCDRFLLSIKATGDFYYSQGNIYNAVKFYHQLREAATLLKRYELVSVGLIFIAKCSLLKNLHSQSIILLKKALQYSWLSGVKEVELKTYDELGQAYYKMGHIEKAKKYHNKYGNAIYQDKNSPLRYLSKKKIQQLQLHNIQTYFQKLDIGLLLMLSLPFRNIIELPILVLSDNENLREKIPEQPKNKPHYDQKVDRSQFMINKVLKHWMFLQSIEQPELSPKESNLAKQSKSRKNWYIDFKMNQYLRSKGIKPLNKQRIQPEKTLDFKQSLQTKINRKLNQPSLPSNWYQKIVKQVINDQKRKLNRINSPICIKKSSKNISISHNSNTNQLFLKYFKAMRDIEQSKKIKLLVFLREI